MSNVYFKAYGSNPQWTLEISEQNIQLITEEETLTFPYNEPHRAMDANVKMYKTSSKSGEISIQTLHNECINETTGDVLPYQVSINYKDSENKTIGFNGCGQYITDYRLYDIWVLEKMNQQMISKEDFTEELPMLEINSLNNKFMGFAGCNSMNGNIFFEKGLLRFTDIATTRMMCGPNNKEADFLKDLRSSTTYHIGNNRLTLSNPNGELLVFKKVD